MTLLPERSSAGHWAAAAVATIGLAVLVVFPEVDLAVSGWFYTPGAGFTLARLPFFLFIMHAVSDLTIGAAIIAGILGVAAAIRHRRVWCVSPRIALFLVASLVIGPGLVVNSLLKDNWGRARPHQIVEFGGSAHFSPAVLLADQCMHNCSFPSGHGALGIWLVAFAMVLPRRYQRLGIPVALTVGGLIGLMRVVQGAHFLSDVIAAALIVVGLNYILKRLILDEPSTPPP